MPGVEAIVEAVERLPDIALETDDRCGAAAVRVGARVIARIDLRNGTVFVSFPPDTIPMLRQVFPSGRPLGRGMEFDVVGAHAAAEALAAIRRRANVERRVWQFQVRSP